MKELSSHWTWSKHLLTFVITVSLGAKMSTSSESFSLFFTQQKGTPMKGLQVNSPLPPYPPEPVAPPQGKKGTSALSALLEMEQNQKWVSPGTSCQHGVCVGAVNISVIEILSASSQDAGRTAAAAGEALSSRQWLIKCCHSCHICRQSPQGERLLHVCSSEVVLLHLASADTSECVFSFFNQQWILG